MSHVRAITAMRRRGRLAASGDRGLSLPELLVTMLLLGIVGTTVVTQFTSVSRALQTTDRRIDNTVAAQQGMQVVTKDLRAATRIQQSAGGALPAFTSIATDALTVHSFVGVTPVKVQYSIDGQGRLMKQAAPTLATSTAPNWQFSATSTSTVVVRGISNPAGRPVFTYRDAAGAALPVPSTSAAVLNRVRTVDVALVVQTDPLAQTPAADVEHEVYLPNQEVQ